MTKTLRWLVLSLLLSIGVISIVWSMAPSRVATASFNHPWWRIWSSEWRAKGKASVGHARFISNLIAHDHGGSWSTYAEIYGLEPDSDSDNVYWIIPAPMVSLIGLLAENPR